MSIRTVDPAVLRYLEVVRTHLDDLPGAEGDDLLEDLEDHLAEVAAEGDGSLEDRLGPPVAYADELRASAGYPSREELAARRPARKLAERISSSPIWRSVSRVVESPQGRASLRFARELRPGWWVLRGYLAVVGPVYLFSEQPGSNTILPFWGGWVPAGFLAITVAIVVSVWLGRRAERTGRARFLSIVFSAAVVATSAGAAAGWGGGVPYYEDVAYVEEQPFLHHADGSAIANICPYSSDGKLLSGVLLFDQGGRAIINTADTTDGYGIQRQLPAILNAYPLTISALDETGQPTPVLCPPSIIAQPTQSAPASPAAAPPAGD